MPKKAVLASARSQGIKLAISGPNKSSGSQTPKQTGSSTQSGSSIQKKSKEVIGSSTQPTSSNQTAKQTKLDYAIPIQTLLALQDQGLTTLPKKTWADIVSDEEQEGENLDLALLIKNLKNHKTICNPRMSQELQTQSTQKPVSKDQTHYIAKNKFSSIVQLEPEYWDNNPNKITAKIFPEGFHFRPSACNKTRQFYEFVLVDTDCVAIKHYRDPKDSSNFTHSTFQILKVLSPSQYGKNPNVFKKFSKNFDPIGYNYWDYIDAWTRVFWYQNKTYRHSWLIYFKRNNKYNFPNWFLQWWDLKPEKNFIFSQNNLWLNMPENINIYT